MNKKIFCALLFAISLVSSASLAHADSIFATVSTDASPYGFASLGTKMYVTNSGTSTVTVIDTANNFATTTIQVGTQPTDILALGAKIYVANYASSSVSVIDTANGNSVTFVNVGRGPQYLTTLGSKVIVSNHIDGSVTIIDPSNGDATTTIAMGYNTNAVLAIGSKIYVAHLGSTLGVIDTANGNATTSIAVNSSFYLAAIGTTLYVPDYSSNINIVDTANGNAVSTVSVAAHAYSIALMGSKIFVIGQNTTTLSIIDTLNGNSVTSIPAGGAPGFVAVLGSKAYFTNNSSGGTLSSVDTTNGNARTNFPSTGSPQRVAVLSPYIFVANTGVSHVSVYVQQYTITYQAGSNGSLTGSTVQTVNVGSSTIAVTAVPQAGYHFVNWNDGSTANPRTDLSVSADATVTANFAIDSVVGSSGSSSGGSISVDDLAKMLAPGPATDAYLASRGLRIKSSVSSAQLPVAVSTSTSGFMIDLGPGSVGPDVKKIQQYLNAHGFTIAPSGPGSPDNESDRFGALTLSAVRKFQKAHGISATGYVGPLTRKALNQ